MFQSRSVEVMVGFFVALGFGALLVLSMKVSNLSTLTFGDRHIYHLNAHFDNVGGIKVRSPVKMAGVRIGEVADIRVDGKTYRAVAILEIDNKYKQIPRDTIANIYTAGLLGEQYVALDPGGDDHYLVEGDKIKMSQSAVVLEQVIGEFLYNKAAGDDKKDDKKR
jgi:phospholipid/cholesterol/gamma-HCH transport system substrate-binding protein